MCPPGCQHRGFVATHALGHVIYGIYTHTYIYVLHILYHIMLYIIYIYHIYVILYICTFINMHIYKHILISHATKLHNVAITLNTEHST